MDSADILGAAKEFRRGILSGAPSDEMCFVVCAPLCGFLGVFGIESRVTEGEVDGSHHYWLTLDDGRVLDPTADQFGRTAVLLENAPDGYEEYSPDPFIDGESE